MSIKKKMIRWISCLAFLAVLGGLLFNVFHKTGSAAASTTDDKGFETIRNITDGRYGDVVSKQGASIYDDVFKENLMEYEDDYYIYLMNEGGRNTKAILISQVADTPLYDAVESVGAAEEIAVKLANESCPDFFTFDYEVHSLEAGENESRTYTVELWEKVEEKFYTGNKIAVILSAKGHLESFVSRTGGAPIAMFKNQSMIAEDTAVDIAYESLSDVVQNLEDTVNQTRNKSGADLKETSEPIVSDAYLLGEKSDFGPSGNTAVEKEEYNIEIEDREVHVVEAYKEMNKGLVEWVIQIGAVQTNEEWGDISFRVHVDALTGETGIMNYTR